MASWMWIIAGPNGAGKSTFANQFLHDLGHGNLVKLNADERLLAIAPQFPDETRDALNLRAAIAVDKDVADMITAGRSFVVETVLSSDKYRDDVLAAKAAGFKVGFIYVSLYPPELSPQRVSERVAKGGHHVETKTAIDRHRRSHEQLKWFAPQADILMVFDNSDSNAAPVLLASRQEGAPFRIRARGVNPAVDQALADLPPASAGRPPQPG